VTPPPTVPTSTEDTTMTQLQTDADPDGIYPGQYWASRYETGATVRVTVVDAKRIGYSPKGRLNTVKYLTRTRFTRAYARRTR